MNAEQLAAMVGCPVANVAANWPLLEQCLDALGIGSVRTKIAALATVAVETAHTFLPVHEYGPDSLHEQWYGHRRDLGNLNDGDGAKYAGRGFIQETGKANYAADGKAIGIDLIDDPLDPKDDHDPDKALEPATAAALLANFFYKRKVYVAADAGAWIKVRKLVNGGTNGLRDFMTCIARLSRAIAVPQSQLTNGGDGR